MSKFRIESPFKELPNDILWNHYDNEYGYLIVKDKVILDIGADVGTTADYWLQHGAKKIYAVEGEQTHYKQLLINIKNQKWEDVVKAEEMIVCNKNQFVYLLNKYHADIVKIDCEGCEQFWLETDDKTMSIPNVYLIEFHKQAFFERGTDRLQLLGYKLEKLVKVNYGVYVALYNKESVIND